MNLIFFSVRRNFKYKIKLDFKSQDSLHRPHSKCVNVISLCAVKVTVNNRCAVCWSTAPGVVEMEVVWISVDLVKMTNN